MKTLVLIHPRPKGGFAGFGDTASWGMPPLALGYVAALTPPGWDIRIIDEYVEQLNPEIDADLVGITAYSVNANRAYELATRFRARGIPVVLGGIHVSMVPDEAAHYADAVVIGEAEGVWAAVVKDAEHGTLKPRYHGTRLPLDDLPMPRWDLFPKAYGMAVVQTTRGCPFACEFCSVTTFNGAEYRQRPVGDVLAELEQIDRKLVYFVDDNFFGSGRQGEERAIALCKGMVERKLKKIWVTQASINVAGNPDVLTWAYRSGCRGFYIGFESVLDESLKEMHKTPNMALGQEGIAAAVKTIQRHGIAIIGAFIFGNDHDTRGVFARTLRFMDRIDAVQFTFLTPFPGTRLTDRLRREGRLLYDNFPADWNQCDTDHVMVRPAHMTIVDLVRGFDWVVRKRFSTWAVLKQAAKTLVRTRSVAATLLAWGLNRDSATAFAAQKQVESWRETGDNEN